MISCKDTSFLKDLGLLSVNGDPLFAEKYGLPDGQPIPKLSVFRKEEGKMYRFACVTLSPDNIFSPLSVLLMNAKKNNAQKVLYNVFHLLPNGLQQGTETWMLKVDYKKPNAKS